MIWILMAFLTALACVPAAVRMMGTWGSKSWILLPGSLLLVFAPTMATLFMTSGDAIPQFYLAASVCFYCLCAVVTVYAVVALNFNGSGRVEENSNLLLGEKIILTVTLILWGIVVAWILGSSLWITVMA